MSDQTRRVGAAVLAAAVAGLLPGCGAGEGQRDGIRVVAGFYPLAEAARRVGGGGVAVTDLTPAGAEPHDLEVTPPDVDAIEDADLVVLLGGGFQPAVEAAAARRDEEALEVLDAIGAADSPTGDPHVWLDPALMSEIVDVVAGALARADPDHADGHRARAREYLEEIAAVDAEYERTLATCERDLVVSAHRSFGWLTARYGLRLESVAGLSPDQEPDPARLAELADLARREGVTTVFTEVLVPSDIAETLAREAGGLRTAVLDPLEGLTDEAREAGADWTSVMRDNLAALADALGCAAG